LHNYTYQLLAVNNTFFSPHLLFFNDNMNKADAVGTVYGNPFLLQEKINVLREEVGIIFA